MANTLPYFQTNIDQSLLTRCLVLGDYKTASILSQYASVCFSHSLTQHTIDHFYLYDYIFADIFALAWSSNILFRLIDNYKPSANFFIVNRFKRIPQSLKEFKTIECSHSTLKEIVCKNY